MDTALVVITLLSVALTGALLVYASRLQREQREREDARVTALAREIRVDEGTASVFRAPAGSADHASPEAPAAPSWDTLAETSRQAVEVRGLFGSPAGSDRSARRLTIAGVGALVVSMAVGALYFASVPGAGAPSGPAAGTPHGALELVSLDHSRRGDALAIRGVVRNPRGAEARRAVAAVVFAFDQTGGFLTSARSAIDYQVLEPGDESPFSVSVPHAATAARYRVSFRGDRDVLPHVDRRTTGETPAAVR